MHDVLRLLWWYTVFLAVLHTQDIPRDIRAQLLAPNGAIGGALDLRTAFGRYAARPAFPLPDSGVGHSEVEGKGGGGTNGGDSAVDGRQSDG